MENAIKTLETTLAERNAAIRILQSKSQTSNMPMNINNIEESLESEVTNRKVSQWKEQERLGTKTA